MEAAITSPCWENQAKDEEIPWMASRDHGKVWVRRDLEAHPIPKNPTGHLPSSQVAPIPIQTLPWGSHSFSRLGRSAGNGCELPQPQLLSGRFLPGMFSPPGSVNPLSGRVLVSSTSSGFALTSIPEFPRCRCHPEPPLSPSQKLFLRRSFSVSRDKDPHEPRVFFTSSKFLD